MGWRMLLEQLVSAVPDVPWMRVMYAYPGYVTDRLIEVMAEHQQIVPYLDIPLQHADRRTLLRMRRPANIEWVHETLGKMRAAMPDLAIRTTFIVGYPGETDEEFETLVKFVEEMRFDRVGCFTYSYEPGTPSADLPDQVEEDVKDRAPRPADEHAAADQSGAQSGAGRADAGCAGRGARRSHRRRRHAHRGHDQPRRARTATRRRSTVTC